mmetsp:Transcript_25505/g.4239  ORF Transcript_25505/g.4239 Transcript_25505/m.4239 type:complete len:90 (+) Transcript_25505:5-274(+)
MPSSPAWTIAKRQTVNESSPVPGPGAYSPKYQNRSKSPKYSFASPRRVSSSPEPEMPSRRGIYWRSGYEIEDLQSPSIVYDISREARQK